MTLSGDLRAILAPHTDDTYAVAQRIIGRYAEEVDRAYDEGAADALHGVVSELMDHETVTAGWLRSEAARLGPKVATP